ncbi:MAG: hypothetical protein NTV61_05635 [Candidatus Bathyarchaeota archaeon]|nr:hypothetical protein [Candidatus Bathyarchaeota archaeon]
MSLQLSKPKTFTKLLKEDGIKTILLIIYNAYTELLKENIINKNMSEVEINEELYLRVQELFYKSSLAFLIYPLPEKLMKKQTKTSGRFPAIDICFRDKFDKQSFFGIECKILENNTSSSKQYIEEGVKRYLSGKYYGKIDESSMVGYIKEGNINQIIENIKIEINLLGPIQPLTQSYNFKDFNYHYYSMHKVAYLTSDYLIHHLFFSF